jgi:hypothetical protein
MKFSAAKDIEGAQGISQLKGLYEQAGISDMMPKPHRF